ncbi:MAG: hypothetical protein AAB276_02515, partial [Pseudomonadota bacterium]
MVNNALGLKQRKPSGSQTHCEVSHEKQFVDKFVTTTGLVVAPPPKNCGDVIQPRKIFVKPIDDEKNKQVHGDKPSTLDGISRMPVLSGPLDPICDKQKNIENQSDSLLTKGNTSISANMTEKGPQQGDSKQPQATHQKQPDTDKKAGDKHVDEKDHKAGGPAPVQTTPQVKTIVSDESKVEDEFFGYDDLLSNLKLLG